MTNFFRAILLMIAVHFPAYCNELQLRTELLIVGGNEAACAAAIQAARLGVKDVVLVNDIEWLGGQFSAEGVGCLDEWTTVNSRRVNFPRSGLFQETVDRIRAYNSAKYGLPSPGNAWCGTETIEPAAAAKIFAEMLAPYEVPNGGPIRRLSHYEVTAVLTSGKRVTGVEFIGTSDPANKLRVEAKLTIDSSDWGDVIRLSGAAYGAGPDLQSRFNEPSAPIAYDAAGRQEMNPLSWCLVLREADAPQPIPPPPAYDVRSYSALDKTPPWVESDMSAGIYAPGGWSIYTHRRLVDRRHNRLAPGTEATFLNWPVQDYPLCQLPQRVVEALEANEEGASKKNIVDMNSAQRKIIFADAKHHALGMLHYLQTAVHERTKSHPVSFRNMRLTEEFGTADRLPPKPYVREGLRLEALAMLSENDIRASSREPKWAKSLPPDAILGFQFNIDFHPTRRKFLTGDTSGPWHYEHTASRGWHTDTDRAVFPLRGLVPIEYDGLLGCGKNIGVSSVVQSALRLHGQMMLVGQASATVAAMSLRDAIEPRTIAADPQRWREIQTTLVRGRGGPGVLLFPWHDLPHDAPHFEAANMLAVQGIWRPDRESVFFEPERFVTRAELAELLVRLIRSRRDAPEFPKTNELAFEDLPEDDPSHPSVSAMLAWGDFQPQQKTFRPRDFVSHADLHRWLTCLKLPTLSSDAKFGERMLTRAELVRTLDAIQRSFELWYPEANDFLSPNHDADGDGKLDRDDLLPFDRRNKNLPDRLHAEG